MTVDRTGEYAWPAGARLARDLDAIVACRGLSVCDLGCGLGALGAVALAADAASVAFLDGSADALAAVKTVNGGDARASFLRHEWGSPLPARYGLILGGDILYRPECFAALLDSIASGLDERGRCLLSDPRSALEPELPALAAQRGLGWTTERRTDFTLVRVWRTGGLAAG